MKPVAAALLTMTVGWLTPDGGTPITLRVLTYNIHHGEGTDGVFDLTRLADIISSVTPDLVALQEVDDGTERSDKVHQLAELGRLTGLHSAFGPAMAFRGGEYGVGVLSRWPLLKEQNRPLPGSADREPRTTLTVDVQPANGAPRILFTSTHLDQGRDIEGRNQQAMALNDILANDDEALSILAGDFNSRMDSETLDILRTKWTEVSPTDQVTTSPTGRPSFRVDYVMVRPAARWRVIESRVLDAPIASDHRPVLVVLELSKD